MRSVYPGGWLALHAAVGLFSAAQPQCWEPQGPAAAVMGTRRRRRKLLDLFPSQAFQNTGANISYIPG